MLNALGPRTFPNVCRRVLSTVSLNHYLVDEMIEGMRKGRWREGCSQDPYTSICIKVLLRGSATNIDGNVEDTGPWTVPGLRGEYLESCGEDGRA